MGIANEKLGKKQSNLVSELYNFNLVLQQQQIFERITKQISTITYF
jgi:hypothetical protein